MVKDQTYTFSQVVQIAAGGIGEQCSGSLVSITGTMDMNSLKRRDSSQSLTKSLSYSVTLFLLDTATPLENAFSV
jgi:hypothetical protein